MSVSVSVSVSGVGVGVGVGVLECVCARACECACVCLCLCLCLCLCPCVCACPECVCVSLSTDSKGLADSCASTARFGRYGRLQMHPISRPSLSVPARRWRTNWPNWRLRARRLWTRRRRSTFAFVQIHPDLAIVYLLARADEGGNAAKPAACQPFHQCAAGLRHPRKSLRALG